MKGRRKKGKKINAHGLHATHSVACLFYPIGSGSKRLPKTQTNKEIP